MAGPAFELQAAFFQSRGWGLPWWSSGEDSAFPMQGAQGRSLVRELDPICHNEDLVQPNKSKNLQTKTQIPGWSGWVGVCYYEFGIQIRGVTIKLKARVR